MNRVEVEALLYRMSKAFPGKDVGDSATVDEWVSSSIAHFTAAQVFAGLDDWKEANDWPPSIHQMLEQTQVTARRVAAETVALMRAEQSEYQDGELDTFSCSECFDRGYVHMDPNDENSPVRPCSTCRPDTFTRWRGGHYKPGHDCSECAALRRGTKTGAGVNRQGPVAPSPQVAAVMTASQEKWENF